MIPVCIVFQVHHPIQLRPYNFFQIGKHQAYFDYELSRRKLNAMADQCYLPGIQLLKELISNHKGNFRFGLSLSGTLIGQLEEWRPDVLKELQQMIATGAVDLLSEPYYHSLSFLYNREEFTRQIRMHKAKIVEHFGQDPRVFMNSERVYNNYLAYFIHQMGYQGIITEGAGHWLNDRNPNKLYEPVDVSGLSLLLRNPGFSEDLSIRFHDTHWEHYPLQPNTYLSWLQNQEGDAITLGFSFDKLFNPAKLQKQQMDFWREWIQLAIQSKMTFLTPDQLTDQTSPADKISCDDYISSDVERKDISAWLGTEMQREAYEKIFQLKEPVFNSANAELIVQWSLLQQSDLFYYSGEKREADLHLQSRPGKLSLVEDAYICLMNILSDLELRLSAHKPAKA